MDFTGTSMAAENRTMGSNQPEDTRKCCSFIVF